MEDGRANNFSMKTDGRISVKKLDSKIDIKAMCKKFENVPHSKSCVGKSHSSHIANDDSKNLSCQFRHSVPNIKVPVLQRPSKVLSPNISDGSKKIVESQSLNTSSKTDSKFVSLEASPRDFPRAPTRRNRTKSQLQTLDIRDTEVELRGVNRCKNADSAVQRVSVRERTKLFETDSPSANIKSSVNRNSHVLKDKQSLKNKCFSSFSGHTENNANGISNGKGNESSSLSCPPVKPPRTPLRNKLAETKEKFSAPDRSSVSKAEKDNAFILPVSQLRLSKVSKSSLSPDSSSNLKHGIVEGETAVLPRLQSAPLQLVSDDTKLSMPKMSRKAQALLTNKTQGLLNYFKHLSNTASSLREKVKSKPSNAFVDLTPTTVSPPKHHGTLKRSFSDEHIYAEPMFNGRSPEKQASPVYSNLQVSPYMTTLLDPSAVASAVNSETNAAMSTDTNSASTFKNRKCGISVRNMIYQSFSSLRNAETSKDASDLQDDSGSDISVQDVKERIIYVQSVKKQVSVSSICIAPSLFEALFIVCVSKNQPEVVLKFPAKPKQGFDYPLVPHLCFPDLHLLKPVSAYRSETFNFTLVNGKDEKIFGYCHRILGWPGQNSETSFTFPCAICILSCISAPLFYKKLLSELEKHLVLPAKQFESYLSSLRVLGVPNNGANLSVPDVTEGYENARVVISRPLDCHIVSSDFTRILQLLDIDILLKAVASLVLERKVLLLSKYSKDLFQCCCALSSLLYPFHWQHLIIPVLPRCILVQCCTEIPYLLGIISSDHTEILELLTEHSMLIIDIDKASVLKSQGDENTILPKKVQKALVMALNLAKNMTDPTEMLRDIMISEAFVRMFVETIGHYGEFLSPKDSSSIILKEAFQRKPSSKSIQSFLEWFSETQMFDSFIEECIWRIKYREICQSHQLTFFEKRVEEYKWELTYDNEKISQIIGKTMKNFGEKLKILKSF